MGGKRPRQSHGVSVLPDGAGVASVAERYTRGTGVVTPLNVVPARTWWIWAGGDAHSPLHDGVGNSPEGSIDQRGARGDVLRDSHGEVAGVEPGASSAERSTSEHGNRSGTAGVHASSGAVRLGPPSTDRVGTGRSRRSSPSPGEPVTVEHAQQSEHEQR